MIYSVEISNQADMDLREIYEYIAYELLSPDNASGQLGRLEKCILGLNQMPDCFQEYGSEPWKSRGLRVVPVDNYLVFYIPNKKTKVVTIIRVMYAGRDVDTQLNRFTKI